MSSQPKCDTQVPLLVKIQTIEVEKLDLKSTVPKNKLITYVEGTNRFIFVGCTSGTVYAFTRDSLRFLFVIPFKGGKVCLICCTDDERDVAVCSISGKVALYRLLEAKGNYASSQQGTLSAKQLYLVNHHHNNEITEMRWSPNGNFLFIGDNKGIISQVDIRSIDEFPYPTPSRVILQVQGRILQLDCVFPYLAVNSLAGVFLCDVQNEDFTRIHSPDRKTVLRAIGVCLVVSGDTAKTDDSPSVSLFVTASNPSGLLRYSVQGNFIERRELHEDNPLYHKELVLFDPKEIVVPNRSGSAPAEFRPSFGKLFTSDCGYIISASNHQIMIIDPNRPGLRTVFWNDEFRRISSLKVLFNYLFVWETGKLHVLALTYFRPYGEQLLGANLRNILENWVQYALNTIGGTSTENNEKDQQQLQQPQESSQHSSDNDNTDDENQDVSSVTEDKEDNEGEKETEENRVKEEAQLQNACELLSLMVRPGASLDLDDEYSKLVFSLVPPTMKAYIFKEVDDEMGDLDPLSENSTGINRREEKEEILPNPIQDALVKLGDAINKFLEDFEVDSNFDSNLYRFYIQLWKVLTDFYEEIDAQLPYNIEDTDEDSVIFKQNLLQNNKMSMDNLIQSILLFFKQGSLKVAGVEFLSVNFPVKSYDSCRTGVEKIVHKLNSYQLQPGNFIKLLETDGMEGQVKGGKAEDSDSLSSSQTEAQPPHPQLFPNYARQTTVTKWLTDFRISSSLMQVDSYIAEIFLLLAPLIHWTTVRDNNSDSGNDSDNECIFARLIEHVYRNRFFTWLSLLASSRECERFPYKQRLSDFLVEKIQGSRIQEIITSVYQDLLKPMNHGAASSQYVHGYIEAIGDASEAVRVNGEISKSLDDTKVELTTPKLALKVMTKTYPAARNLHNFATLVHLKTNSKGSNSKGKILSALITNFPFSNRDEEEIRSKLREITNENPMLVEMFRQACITDGNSQKLCSCGLLESYGMPRLYVIPKTQRVVEECILEILMEGIGSWKNKEKSKEKDEQKMQRAFRFAMQRLLFEKYFQVLQQLQQQLQSDYLDDSIRLEIIIRSGQCHLLQEYFPFNLSRLELMIAFQEKLFKNPKGRESCSGCGKSLKVFPNVRTFSWDCIGLWIVGNGNGSNPPSLENEAGKKLISAVTSSDTLNTPGIFSLRFYKLLADADKEIHEVEDSFDAGSKYADIRGGPARFNRSSIRHDRRSTCAALH